MKKRYLVLIGVLVILILGYIGFKCFCLYYYNPKQINKDDFEKLKSGLVFKEDVVINTKSVTEYLEKDNIKIRNDFQDFTLKENWYVLNDSNKDNKVAFTMNGPTETYLDYLKAEDITVYNGSLKNTKVKDRIRFLENNNIKNDIDFFKFMSKQEYPTFNILTSVKEMKSVYSTYLMFNIMIPSVNYINEIKGDYIGYILNLNNIKEVSILKNKKRYILTFLGNDYFTDDYVRELLNTIIIE